MNRLKCIPVLFAIFAILSLVYLITSIRPNLLTQYIQLPDSVYPYNEPATEFRMSEANLEGPRNILLWTSIFRNTSWYLSSSTTMKSDFFQGIKCPITECTITNNRTYLKSIDMFDAVLFHGAEEWSPTNVPAKRGSHQFYVMGTRESPYHTKHDLNRNRGFFNWSMTYRLDSDVIYEYGLVKDKSSNLVVAPAVAPTWRQPEGDFFDESLLRIVEKKKKKIAWFVSHCQTPSRREVLVNQMKKLMPVDIYGGCSSLKCPRATSAACEQMLTDDYKFYLSFENSLCTDYVTEKLYNTMKQTVIPVVYSGADYSRFAPPLSYIDANTFDSPEDLVEYLIYLDNNPKEYIKYFWWRQHYEIMPDLTPSQAAFCQLCMKLHSKESLQHFVYSDIKSWWFDDACTDKPAKISF